MQPALIGIDIGGVIIKKIDPNSDTSFSKDFLRTPAIENAIESIREIAGHSCVANVFLVSKCGPEVEALTKQWLDEHFFRLSGINPTNVHFCRKRNQKAEICEALGVTHFIDDRLEVLSYLTAVENLYLFQPLEAEIREFGEYLDRVHRVQTWSELKVELLHSFFRS